MEKTIEERHAELFPVEPIEPPPLNVADLDLNNHWDRCRKALALMPKVIPVVAKKWASSNPDDRPTKLICWQHAIVEDAYEPLFSGPRPGREFFGSDFTRVHVWFCGRCKEASESEMEKRLSETGARRFGHVDGYNGETQTLFFVYDPKISDDEIYERLGEAGYRVEYENCHHAYDCCGRWYSGGLRITRGRFKTLARIGFSLNV